MAKKLSIREITPVEMSCMLGPCPALFQVEEGYLVIGEVVSPKLYSGKLKSRISENEVLIKIPKTLLKNLRK